MNYLLLLLIIALGAGGYYEYTTIQATNSSDQQEFSDLSAKIDALQSSEKELKQSVADLTKQVTGGPMQLNAGTAPSTPGAPNVSTPQTSIPPATNSGPPPSNDLGTIITNDKTYTDAHLMAVKFNCIVVKYADGIAEVKYADLKPELQKRFGYDPQLNNNLTPEQIVAAEKQRQAAGN